MKPELSSHLNFEIIKYFKIITDVETINRTDLKVKTTLLTEIKIELVEINLKERPRICFNGWFFCFWVVFFGRFQNALILNLIKPICGNILWVYHNTLNLGFIWFPGFYDC